MFIKSFRWGFRIGFSSGLSSGLLGGAALIFVVVALAVFGVPDSVLKPVSSGISEPFAAPIPAVEEHVIP